MRQPTRRSRRSHYRQKEGILSAKIGHLRELQRGGIFEMRSGVIQIGESKLEKKSWGDDYVFDGRVPWSG